MRHEVFVVNVFNDLKIAAILGFMNSPNIILAAHSVLLNIVNDRTSQGEYGRVFEANFRTMVSPYQKASIESFF